MKSRECPELFYGVAGKCISRYISVVVIVVALKNIMMVIKICYRYCERENTTILSWD